MSHEVHLMRLISAVIFVSPDTMVILTNRGDELVSSKSLCFVSSLLGDSLFTTLCFTSWCTNNFILVGRPNVP